MCHNARSKLARRLFSFSFCQTVVNSSVNRLLSWDRSVAYMSPSSMGRFRPNLNKSESHLWAHKYVFEISDSLQCPFHVTLTKMLLYLAARHLPSDASVVRPYFRYNSFSVALPTAVKSSHLIYLDMKKKINVITSPRFRVLFRSICGITVVIM